MAMFNAELPNDLIKDLEKLEVELSDMLGEMTKEGAKVVYESVKNNMKKSFKTTNSLEKGLKITKVYTNSSGEIVTKIGFFGYNDDGVPIPLIALAREYGTSRGEVKKPFFRKSFSKKQIEQAMLKVQNKYLPKE